MPLSIPAFPIRTAHERHRHHHPRRRTGKRRSCRPADAAPPDHCPAGASGTGHDQPDRANPDHRHLLCRPVVRALARHHGRSTEPVRSVSATLGGTLARHRQFGPRCVSAPALWRAGIAHRRPDHCRVCRRNRYLYRPDCRVLSWDCRQPADAPDRHRHRAAAAATADRAGSG